MLTFKRFLELHRRPEVSNESKQLQYKVGWKLNKHPKSPAVVMDYMAPNLKYLLKILKESEGVSASTTEYIYIHEIDPAGGVREVFTHEGGTGLVVAEFRPSHRAAESEQQQVLQEVRKVLETTIKTDNPQLPKQTIPTSQKPRIRLKSTTQTNTTLRTEGFFYQAAEARSI
jgi:hypothetical protein